MFTKVAHLPYGPHKHNNYTNDNNKFKELPIYMNNSFNKIHLYHYT